MLNHVVVGGGPLGRATVRALLARRLPVRLVSRTPRMDAADGLELVSADATDPRAIRAALEGAGTVYNCANAPYHRWAHDLPPIWDGILDAARAAGARLVIASNLYAYGRPDGMLTADAPFAPVATKGRVRAELEQRALEADARGDVRVAVVRASDFYGPQVSDSVLGDRFFSSALRGRPAQLYGRMDAPHSYAYLPDFAEALAAVGTSTDDGTFGRSWIAPHDRPATAVELQSILRREIDGARVTTMGRGMLRLGGLFIPAAREMIEMIYEFEEPFVIDAAETETTFDLEATPLEEGIATTVRWYGGVTIESGVGA